jgi:hypothetical protein
MDRERSPLFTIANKVARETATSETSMPYREVEDAEVLRGEAKEADTHLIMMIMMIIMNIIYEYVYVAL